MLCAPAAWAAAAPGERGISADAGFEAPEESPEYGRAKELLQIAVMHGRDDREKIKEALFWLESGTAKNCPHAMALLGSYYLDGGFTERSRREAERDPEKGMALLRRAAAMDTPAAHIVLGRIYFNGGCGVARDAEAGLAHFDRAIGSVRIIAARGNIMKRRALSARRGSTTGSITLNIFLTTSGEAISS